MIRLSIFMVAASSLRRAPYNIVLRGFKGVAQVALSRNAPSSAVAKSIAPSCVSAAPPKLLELVQNFKYFEM